MNHAEDTGRPVVVLYMDECLQPCIATAIAALALPVRDVREFALGVRDVDWLPTVAPGVIVTSDGRMTRRAREVAAYRSAGHMVVVDQGLLRRVDQHVAAALICLAWTEMTDRFTSGGAGRAFRLKTLTRRSDWLSRMD